MQSRFAKKVPLRQGEPPSGNVKHEPGNAGTYALVECSQISRQILDGNDDSAGGGPVDGDVTV
jgi:hypothetical protein